LSPLIIARFSQGGDQVVGGDIMQAGGIKATWNGHHANQGVAAKAI
jgi:hypothetical protein